MKNRNLLILIAGLFSFFISCKGQTKNEPQIIVSDKFKVGQVWRYDNRPGEDSSTLTILKIEKYEKGDTIIHIRIDGVRIYNPQLPSGYSDFIAHLPYSEKALSKCVTSLVGQNDTLPDFSEGYKEWNEAFDNGKAGCWTADIKEAVDGIDQAMRPKKEN
ncbi:MAG TPA: hypothetical protein VE978_11710 [Chitinophagales bacterium]|nr:hypothetical protein [Chitinophagales bacterium]